MRKTKPPTADVIEKQRQYHATTLSNLLEAMELTTSAWNSFVNPTLGEDEVDLDEPQLRAAQADFYGGSDEISKLRRHFSDVIYELAYAVRFVITSNEDEVKTPEQASQPTELAVVPKAN